MAVHKIAHAHRHYTLKARHQNGEISLPVSGAKSVRSSALFEAIKSVFEATIPAKLQIATKLVPLSEVERYWSAPGKPRVVFTLG